MPNIEDVRKYLKQRYNISNDGELIKALAKLKPLEIGIFTRGCENGQKQP